MKSKTSKCPAEPLAIVVKPLKTESKPQKR